MIQENYKNFYVCIENSILINIIDFSKKNKRNIYNKNYHMIFP